MVEMLLLTFGVAGIGLFSSLYRMGYVRPTDGSDCPCPEDFIFNYWRKNKDEADFIYS